MKSGKEDRMRVTGRSMVKMATDFETRYALALGKLFRRNMEIAIGFSRWSGYVWDLTFTQNERY